MQLSAMLCEELQDFSRLQGSFEQMLAWAVDEQRYSDGMIRCQGRSVLARGVKKEKLTQLAFEYCVDAAIRLHRGGHVKSLRELWTGNYPEHYSQQAFLALVDAKDVHIVDVWLASVLDMPKVREASNQSAQQACDEIDERDERTDIANCWPSISYTKMGIYLLRLLSGQSSTMVAHDAAASSLAQIMLKEQNLTEVARRPAPVSTLASRTHPITGVLVVATDLERRSVAQVMGANSLIRWLGNLDNCVDSE